MRRTGMKKPGESIAFKSIFNLVLLLAVFSAVVIIIGYRGLTDALLEQYAEGAFSTAEIASRFVDADRIDEYAHSGAETEEYLAVRDRLDEICNFSGSTFVYVIAPDRTDYGHITFLFSTMNGASSYQLYDFGYVRETTNDEYREKYRALYEKGSGRELVVRDKGYIETDPHITAMIPLKGSDGQTKAILCVQRQMYALVDARNSHTGKLIRTLVALALLAAAGQGFYIHRKLIRPVKRITDEAGRFAEENVQGAKKLTESIRDRDEIGLLAGSIDHMEEQIVGYIADMTRIAAEKERISTEMMLATRIQAAMLPSVFPPFPDRTDLDIYAVMDPAKEVGGDFYDFFFIDDDRLCLTIGDVSGKGVPAALFMMAVKILMQDLAMSGLGPAKLLETINERVCAKNTEQMFVTIWLGILDLRDGRLTAANAGHEYPVLKRPDGGFELYRDRHSLVVGGMEGVRYREYELTLEPGAKLFLYTDGVPEATDAKGELFGNGRMLEALNGVPGAPAKQLLQSVRQAVDRFTGDAPQFDDLTMLCLEYYGQRREKE